MTASEVLLGLQRACCWPADHLTCACQAVQTKVLTLTPTRQRFGGLVHFLDVSTASSFLCLACCCLLLLLLLYLLLLQASRVLRPGGVFVVAFGPDCFKGKATAAWLNRNMQERADLVQT